MSALDRIAEERIREAVDAGLFRDLPGLGEPLELEDLSGLQPDLRASYLLLKGANVLPEELGHRKEALRLADLLAACEDSEERAELSRRHSRALLRLELARERRLSPSVRSQYRSAVLRKLAR